MSRVSYKEPPCEGFVSDTELTIKHSRNALTSGPNILDIIGSGIWAAETGVSTVPPATVDFSGDEAGIGGGGISSEAFPALVRVVAAIVCDPLFARGAAFGGIAPQLSSNLGEFARNPQVGSINFEIVYVATGGLRRTIGKIGQGREDQLETGFIATQHRAFFEKEGSRH